MRIRDAITMIQKYWGNCPSTTLIEEAKRDHGQALRELSGRGYTWGFKHQLPFDFTETQFNKNDYKIMLNVLYGKQERRRKDYEKKARPNKGLA